MSLDKTDISILKNYVYTSYSDVKAELDKRRKDTNLKKKIEAFWGDNSLDVFGAEPCAVLTRTIFTPNLEFEYFLDMAKDFNMNPLLLEYGGKFVAKNLEKYHLCRLFSIDHIGKKGGILFSSKKIVNFNKDEGKDVSDIKTLDGKGLIDFHHQLLEYQYPGMIKNIENFSEWFNKTRFLTEHYYFYFFTLFLYHGVLFENFLMDDKEESIFIKDHVLSSFKKVHEYFGVKPFIVPLLPVKNESFRTWFSYRSNIKDLIK